MSASQRVQLEQLFNAERIAVVGASASRREATGNQIIRNLSRGSGDVTIIPVSPSATVLEGYATAPSIGALPLVDAAVVAVGGSKVAGVVAELERVGCPLVVVVSVGVEEADQDILRSIHRRGITAVHGPNCMGVISPADGVHIWADEGNLEHLSPGPIALVSQSGSGAIFVARSLDQVGLSRVISSGNEIGLTTADYVDWLAEDPQTTTIGLVVESIPDGSSFSSAVERAQRAGKRVIALKVGRTPQGAAATVAHTGALLSDDDAYVALFSRAGVPLVNDYDELATSLQLAAALPGGSLPSARAGVITISGGQAALAADAAARVGVRTLPFTPATVTRLRALDPGTHGSNPFDAAAGPHGSDDDFRSAIEIIAADDNVDVVVVVLDAQSTLSDVELAFEDEYFRAAREADACVPVVVVSSSSVSLHSKRLSEFGERRPLVRGIGNAMTAIRSASLVSARRVSARPPGVPTVEELGAEVELLSKSSGAIDSAVAAALLHRYGIPIASGSVVSRLSDACEWAAEHGYPCVLKVSSPDIPHRSDIGGVALGIRNEAELESAWDSILENVAQYAPHAVVEGLEIQLHLEGRIEGFAGFVSDPRLGATVGIGMGGVLVELLDDVARHASPFDSATADDLIRSTRLGRLLSGYRSLHPRTDLSPLRDMLARLSWLAQDFRGVLVEADLNPVLINPGSGEVAIVDALLIARPNAGSGDGGDSVLSEPQPVPLWVA